MLPAMATIVARRYALDGVHVVAESRDDLPGARGRVEVQAHALELNVQLVAQVDMMPGRRRGEVCWAAHQAAQHRQATMGHGQHAQQL